MVIIRVESNAVISCGLADGYKLAECFLILNFRRVLIVVSFLLGKSPASVY